MNKIKINIQTTFTLASILCQSLNSGNNINNNSSSGAIHKVYLIALPFVILSHTNNPTMNLSEAKVGKLCNC